MSWQDLKSQGGAVFGEAQRQGICPKESQAKYDQAKDLYEKAIKALSKDKKLDKAQRAKEEGTLRSNLSGTLAFQKEYKQSADEAKKSAKLRPNWWKPYSRQAYALLEMAKKDSQRKTFQAALETYEKARELAVTSTSDSPAKPAEITNMDKYMDQCRKGLAACEGGQQLAVSKQPRSYVTFYVSIIFKYDSTNEYDCILILTGQEVVGSVRSRIRR